jgi:hypothetical protein
VTSSATSARSWCKKIEHYQSNSLHWKPLSSSVFVLANTPPWQKAHFDSSLYERLALSRDKEGIKQLSHHGQVVSKPQDVLWLFSHKWRDFPAESPESLLLGRRPDYRQG